VCRRGVTDFTPPVLNDEYRRGRRSLLTWLLHSVRRVIGHHWRVIARLGRIERWLNGLWWIGVLGVLVVSVWSGVWWLAAWTAAWVAQGLWRLRAREQNPADADLPPRDPSFRTQSDAPTRP
jgi:hypothetical protein